MDRIAVLCPHCGREGKLPETVKSLPKTVKCPGCQNQFHPAATQPDEFTVVPDPTAQLGELARKAASGLSEKAKDAAKKVKDYATSDDAKAAMDTAWRRAEEVGGKTKEAASALLRSEARFLEKPLVIGLSMLFCFPVGLLLVWRHSLWTKSTKWAWTGALAAFFVFMTIMSAQTRKELAEADALWQAGDKAAAVEKYRHLFIRLHSDEKPLAYGRVIDYEVESGNVGEARKLLEEAIGRGVHPAVNNAEAKTLQAKIETEAAKALQAKLEEETWNKAAKTKALQAKRDREAKTTLDARLEPKTFARVDPSGRTTHELASTDTPDARTGEIWVIPLPTGVNYTLKLGRSPHVVLAGLDKNDYAELLVTMDSTVNSQDVAVALWIGRDRYPGEFLNLGKLVNMRFPLSSKGIQALAIFQGTVELEINKKRIEFMRSDGEMNGLVNRFNKMFLGHVIPADGSVVY